MWSDKTREAILDDVADQIKKVTAPNSKLMRDIITRTSIRFESMSRAGKTKSLERLIEDGAWCDAVFALIEIELPGWSVRRLVHEDGEWFCSLSREPNLPAALDDTADANHQVLALAILSAFLQARRRSLAAQVSRLPVPVVKAASPSTFCCDNFF